MCGKVAASKQCEPTAAAATTLATNVWQRKEAQTDKNAYKCMDNVIIIIIVIRRTDERTDGPMDGQC